MLFRLVLLNIKKNYNLFIVFVFSFFVSIFCGYLSLYIYGNVEKYFYLKFVNLDSLNKFTITKIFNGESQESNSILLEKFSEKLKNDDFVENVYSMGILSVPSTFEINLFGNVFSTDAFIFVASDKYFDDYGFDKDGFGLSNIALDIYNNSLGGKQTYFPFLDKKIIGLLPAKIIFGKSSVVNFDNNLEKISFIRNFSYDFPIMGISISEKMANEIVESVGRGKINIISIIGFYKNHDSIDLIKQKYGKQVNIEFENEKLKKLQNDLMKIRSIFFIINVIIFLIILCFVYVLMKLIILKNKKINFITYMLGGDFYKIIFINFFEIFIYFLIAGLFASGFYYILQIFYFDNIVSKIVYDFKTSYLGIMEFMIVLGFNFFIILIGILLNIGELKKQN